MIRPRPAPDLAVAPYQDVAVRQATGGAVRPGGTRLTDRALALAALPPGAVVLDLGCGAGTSVRYLAQRHGLRALGIDPAVALVTDARQGPGRLPVLRGRAELLPLADRSVDAVLAECVLSVVPDAERALAEIVRVLRPGGRLLLTDLYARGDPVDGPGAADPCGPREVPARGDQDGDAGGPAFPAGSWLGGTRSRADLLALLHRQGLYLLRWEDHSDELTRLAVRLVWETGSADRLWCTGPGTTPDQLRTALRRVRPGYFLLLADLPRR